MIRGVFISALLLAAAKAAAAAPPIPVPAGEAYVLPPLGTHRSITRLYQAADGHLLLDFYYRDQEGGKGDLLDTATNTRLFPDQEFAIAHSPGGRLEASLMPPGLTKVEDSLFHISGPEGFGVGSGGYEGGSLCHEPYSNPMLLTRPGQPPLRFAAFVKLEKPRAQVGGCDGEMITAHYQDIAFFFFGADAHGFFARSFEVPVVLHFDWNLHSRYLNGHDDVIIVPYDELRGILNGDREETAPISHASFAKGEALIAHYAAQQIRDKQ